MKGALSATRRPLALLAGGLLALGLVSAVSAQEGDSAALDDIISAVDTAWLLIAGFLVFFMQAGFAMLTAGFVRAKETANILMKNMIDACVGGLSFWLVGWAFAYGAGDATNDFIGLGNFALNEFDGYADWFFQFAFAAVAATIVAGALAGRTKYAAYLVYTVVITGLIYPVVVHWGWDVNTWMGAFTDDPDGPWLGNGYVDFAGSGVVHTVGGIAGLMGAIAVGARLGKYGPNGEVRAIPGHNIALATIGMFILWFGWYGFNPGSTLALSGGGAALAARIAVTTTLAAAAGGVTAMLWSRWLTGRYDAGLTINGILAGLVGITAGCATVDPWAAVVIGAIAALVMYYGVQMLDNFKVDDPVGAVSVHAFAGIWGRDRGRPALLRGRHDLGGLRRALELRPALGRGHRAARDTTHRHRCHRRLDGGDRRHPVLCNQDDDGPARKRGRGDAWPRPRRARHRRLPRLWPFRFRRLWSEPTRRRRPVTTGGRFSSHPLLAGISAAAGALERSYR